MKTALRHLVLVAAVMLACIGVTGSVPAHAIDAPQVVGLHLVSQHAQDGKTAPGARGWNNINPGIYARWANGFTAGAYRNSLFRNSLYAGWTFHDSADRFAVTLGLVSGYDRVTDGPGDHQAVRCESTCRVVNLKSVVLPLVVPSVRIGLTDRISARLALIIAPGQPAAAHLALERRF